MTEDESVVRYEPTPESPEWIAEQERLAELFKKLVELEEK